MLLAAALSQIDLSSSLLIAASLIALAVLPSCLTPKVSPQPAVYRPASLCRDRQCHRNQESSQLQFNHSKLNVLRHLNSVRNTPFEHFIGVWFLCVAGASAIYTFYPIMMQEVYGMGQELLSLTFAVAMGLSVFIFAPAGHLAHRFGPMRVLESFLGVRLMAFLSFFSSRSVSFWRLGSVDIVKFLCCCALLAFPYCERHRLDCPFISFWGRGRNGHFLCCSGNGLRHRLNGRRLVSRTVGIHCHRRHGGRHRSIGINSHA